MIDAEADELISATASMGPRFSVTVVMIDVLGHDAASRIRLQWVHGLGNRGYATSAVERYGRGTACFNGSTVSVTVVISA